MASGTLFGPKGRFVKGLQESFAGWLDVDHAVACSSGTAAIHTGLSALGVGPGDEVITTGITDIGALTPILYQGAVPMFADVDVETGNVTAETVEARLTDRTKAIIVTHLLGNPAEVEAICELAHSRGVGVLEDCAQAYGATVGNRKVGTFGDVAAFSLQQGKHITSGEGGIVVTSSPDLARHMRLYVNKAWDYDQPSDHDFMALNYRMTELEAAVAVAQIDGLDENIARRRSNFDRLATLIADVPGVEPTPEFDGARSSYWRVGLTVDPSIVPGGTDALAARLRNVDVPAASRYIKKPAFQTRLFAERNTFANSEWPLSDADPATLDYSEERYPGTFGFLERILVVPWNERLETEHVDRIASAIIESVNALTSEAA